MMQIQFRIRPRHSLLDIDIPLIEKKVANIQGIDKFRIYDDRTSDATFITVIIMFTELTKPIVTSVKRAFSQLSNVTPYIIDRHGIEIDINSISDEDFIKNI